MTAKKPEPEPTVETVTTEVVVPDESTRTPAVDGRCNAEITTADGLLDRCHKAPSHKADHVSWSSYNKAKETAKINRQAFAAWQALHNPEVIAKRNALAAKKLAQLMELADQLGYTVTKIEDESADA